MSAPFSIRTWSKPPARKNRQTCAATAPSPFVLAVYSLIYNRFGSSTKEVVFATTQRMSASHPSIFREYDIRGIFGQTLYEQDAYKIGLGFSDMVREAGGKTVVIGFDGRLSSPALVEALAAGLIEGGMTVTDIGRGPTPMLYFASHHLAADGAIMVTGSHNPPDHNGFKMMLQNKPFFGPQIKRLGALMADRQDGAALAPPAGLVARQSVFDAYVARLLQDFRPGRDLTVVWDPGNGATGEVAVALTSRLPGRHVLINETIDGTFPNHHPDPTDPHTLTQLIERVAAEQADFGIAFDGDGDRIGVIDGLGRILWGDQILVLLAEEVLKERPGATIMADVKASQALFDQIAAMGGQPLMWKTGHSLIKTKMAETGAPLAGEMSGHIFFGDRYYGFDDALYAAIRFLSIIAGWKDQSLAARYDLMPKLVNTPELRFECPDDRKFAVIGAVKARLAGGSGAVNDLDGVRVTHPDGWWLLRASNTQAVLVARCEGKDEETLARLKAELSGHLAEAGIAVPEGL
jgi:phosphomannomutase